jgi:hypothetical protein
MDRNILRSYMPAFRVLQLFALFVIGISAHAADYLGPSPSVLVRAMDALGRRDRTKLEQKSISYILDYKNCEFVPLSDERRIDRHHDARPLDEDLKIDQKAFLSNVEAFARTGGSAQRVKLLRVTGRLLEDSQAEQRSPIFFLAWTVQIGGSAAPITVEGSAFSPNYNNLTGSREVRRNRMMEATAVAYQATVFKIALQLEALQSK